MGDPAPFQSRLTRDRPTHRSSTSVDPGLTRGENDAPNPRGGRSRDNPKDSTGSSAESGSDLSHRERKRRSKMGRKWGRTLSPSRSPSPSPSQSSTTSPTPRRKSLERPRDRRRSRDRDRDRATATARHERQRRARSASPPAPRRRKANSRSRSKSRERRRPVAKRKASRRSSSVSGGSRSRTRRKARQRSRSRSRSRSSSRSRSGSRSNTRRKGSRRSPSRSRSRSRGRARPKARWRSRSSSGSRSRSRRQKRSRRGRSVSRQRRESRSRSREQYRKRRYGGQSGSPDRHEDRGRRKGDYLRDNERRGHRYDRDKHSDGVDIPKKRSRGGLDGVASGISRGATTKASSAPRVDYSSVIPGYDTMDPREKLKARMRYDLETSTTKAQLTDEFSKQLQHTDGRSWMRQVFNKDALLDEEGARPDLDFGDELVGAPIVLSGKDSSHEAAIFGAAPRVEANIALAAEQYGMDGDEDAPVVVELPEESAPPAAPPTDSSKPAPSWRDRALQLQKQRQNPNP